jgi:hypothetical protein
MLRRFNYTGRKKILREDVPVSLQGVKPLVYFDVDFNNIGKYELPPTARLFVEAYEQASYMRFDFGTLGNITMLSKESRVLSEFEGSDGMRFRIKVVDASPDAKLLAEADGILPVAPEEVDENKLPLLPVRHDDLGQELWRISFEDGAQNMPTLLVNEVIEDRIAFVRSRDILFELLRPKLGSALRLVDSKNSQVLLIEFVPAILFVLLPIHVDDSRPPY